MPFHFVIPALITKVTDLGWADGSSAFPTVFGSCIELRLIVFLQLSAGGVLYLSVLPHVDVLVWCSVESSVGILPNNIIEILTR